jgi:thioredoxin 1
MLTHLLILASALAMALPAQAGNAGQKVQAALSSGRPALIEFGANTCTQCKRMKVVLDGVTRRYEGRAHIVQVNIHDDMDVARRFKVMVIPTLVFFDAKGQEKERMYGYQDEMKVVGKLHELGVR